MTNELSAEINNKDDSETKIINKDNKLNLKDTLNLFGGNLFDRDEEYYEDMDMPG